MGDVASFTSLWFPPDASGENPPLLNRLQNACLLNSKIPRYIRGRVPCFLNRHMGYNRPSIRDPLFSASRTDQFRWDPCLIGYEFNQRLNRTFGQVLLFKFPLRLQRFTDKLPAPQNPCVSLFPLFFLSTKKASLFTASTPDQTASLQFRAGALVYSILDEIPISPSRLPKIFPKMKQHVFCCLLS